MEKTGMGILSSNSLYMMEQSMGFLWTKQAAILDNISNAETPNYKTKVVTFEEELRDKLEKASGSRTPKQNIREALDQMEVEVEEMEHSTRMDGNGVNVTEQTAELVRNAYQLQYVMASISGNLNGLRTAIRGQ